MTESSTEQTTASLAEIDPELAVLVDSEGRRQSESIRLIASENYVSQAVLDATGTLLTNKYSEGYVGKRYYEGQQIIDQVEQLPSTGRRTCSASITQTCSPTPGRLPTWRSTSRSYSPATP
jgi:glycine/serine hydroxymethyltransferase